MHRPRRRPGAGLARTGLVLATAFGMVGCAGSNVPAGDGGSGSSSSPTASSSPGLRTRTTIEDVAGTLKPRARGPLEHRVTAVVDRWIDGAYLGSYPRTDFSDAFASFTPGAATRARGDADLMSNQAIGSQLTSVTATNRRLRLDVLAVKGTPVGVTARFALGFDLAGGLRRRDRVTGSLYLTYDGTGAGDWRVFGYDVKRGDL